MTVFVLRSQRHLAYDYRLGLSKKGTGPFTYMALLLVAILVGSGAAFIREGSSVHAVAQTNVQQPLGSNIYSPELNLATKSPLSPIGDDSKLDAIIANYVNSTPQFTWSVAVQGVDSNTLEASFNPDQSFGSASVYKLLLIYPLSQKLPFDSWDNTYLSVDGRSMSMHDCAQLMLKVSDNACAVAVGNWVGWRYADSQLKSLGLSATKLNKASGPTTTAADTTKFLSKLWEGNSFGGDVRQFVLSTLSQQTLRGGIPAGSPGYNVADKTGDLSGLRHDAGIIYAGDKSYILSVFTSGASYGQIAQLSSQIQAYITSLN